VLDDGEIRRILVVTAHPDDVDFAAAGTIARWTDWGIEVAYCVLTDGDAGEHSHAMSRSDVAATRRAEQVAAAACVGVTDVRFLGYPDGRLEPSIGLRRDITRVIRQVRPDRLVCQSPDRNYTRVQVSHPDHRAAGSAALDAVYPDARNPFAFPELVADDGLPAWTVREVWVSGSPQPAHYVDVTETFGRKLAALRAHESQTGQMADLEQRLRGWLSQAAARGGMPDDRLAEAFQVIQTS
jgi:LmbE family N-acetylglucosaminyl deacetylase